MTSGEINKYLNGNYWKTIYDTFRTNMSMNSTHDWSRRDARMIRYDCRCGAWVLIEGLDGSDPRLFGSDNIVLSSKDLCSTLLMDKVLY